MIKIDSLNWFKVKYPEDLIPDKGKTWFGMLNSNFYKITNSNIAVLWGNDWIDSQVDSHHLHFDFLGVDYTKIDFIQL